MKAILTRNGSIYYKIGCKVYKTDLDDDVTLSKIFKLGKRWRLIEYFLQKIKRR